MKHFVDIYIYFNGTWKQHSPVESGIKKQFFLLSLNETTNRNSFVRLFNEQYHQWMQNRKVSS